MKKMVKIYNEKVVTNSKTVSKYFNKRHDNVLRDIRILSDQGVLNFEAVEIITNNAIGGKFDDIKA